MPFPWKKGKNTKISQLVSDHLHSQRRRGGSLVVETGFPTSLVDLFVKNRKRLKKTKKPQDHSLILDTPSPSNSPSPELPTLSLLAPSPSTLLHNMADEKDEVVDEVKEDANFKGLLMAVLRMFFVVVLALGSKKFAVGLTMSALFLIFVEYAGLYLYRLLMPCSEAKKRFRLRIERALQLKTNREEKSDGEDRGFKEPMGQEQEVIMSECSDFHNQRLISPVGEIQVVQPKRFLVPFMEDIQGMVEEVDESDCDGKSKLEISDSNVVVLEEKEEYRCEVLESNRRKSRKAKIKLKMKHIFSTKSKNVKKEEWNLEDEIRPIGLKPVILCEEQEEDKQGSERELECNSDLLSISSRSLDGKEASEVVCSSGVLLQKDMDGVVIREEEETENKGNSGYLFLCLIVLIGLFGGRIGALMLILSWCFLWKSGGMLRRCMTLPVIRFFTQMYS